MSCSNPNMMGFSHYDGYKFRGPRRYERTVMDSFGVMSDGMALYLQDVPCGKCELCLIDLRYSKALRIMLESESYEDSTYFITLTYDSDHVGTNELDHNDWSLFMKNFRQKFCQAKYCNIRDRGTLREGKEYSKTFKNIKQVMTGEYGDTIGRRHFHGIIFNHTFNDLVDTGRVSKKGNVIYTSPSLEAVWGKGIVQVDKITFDLALYVAAYVTDKSLDAVQETPIGFKKQYGRFGRGIGISWITKHWRDVLSTGKVITFEADYPAPRYFIEKIKSLHPKEFERYKRKRTLQSHADRQRSINKGDGPLRRAKAKGRIQFHKQQQRRLHESVR